MWRRLDETSLEHCRLDQISGGYQISGVVLTSSRQRPLQVRYVIQCDSDWKTRQADIHAIQGAVDRRLQLRRDESGTWWRDQNRIPEFDGLPDIDLSVTPSTNTLPIRRMALHIGDGGRTDAVWVRFPDCSLERLPQTYHRLDHFQYLYESGAGSFKAKLEVDEHGLVVRYGSIWERVLP